MKTRSSLTIAAVLAALTNACVSETETTTTTTAQAPAAKGSPSVVGDDQASAPASSSGPHVVYSSTLQTMVLGGSSGGTSTGTGSDSGAPAPTPGTKMWSKTAGSAASDMAIAAASDASSNVLVGGMLGNGADVGCGAHSTTAGAAYVASYSSAGACTWATYFDGDFLATSGVATDSSGNVYATGTFYGNATFGNVSASSNGGGGDGFLVKMSSTGAIQWVVTFGGANDQYVFSLAVSSNGRIGVGGAFYTASSIAGSSLTSNGDADAFVAEFSATDGSGIGAASFGSTDWDAVNGVSFTSDGSLVAAGNFVGTVNPGGTASAITSAGREDAFIVKLNASVVPTAAIRLGGAGSDSVSAVVVDGSDNVHVAGYFQTQADLGSGTPVTGAGYYTGFRGTYGSNLAYSSASTLEASTKMVPTGIALRPNGGVAVVGSFAGTATFGTAQTASLAADDTFVVTYDATGTLSWATTVPSSDRADALGVTVTPGGTVTAVGTFDGNVQVDTQATTSAGSDDVFVLSLAN